MGIYKNNNGNLELIPGTTLFADNPIGTILAYGGATAPKGWLLCQGQAISRTDYAELFSVIGLNFGSGDGITTFNLPDPREAALVGTGINGLHDGDIAAHNVLNLGEFQDDAFQEHAHYLYINNDYNYPVKSSKSLKEDGDSIWSCIPSGAYNIVASKNLTGNRASATTHGKQLGVNFIIKAKQVSVPADFAGAAEAAGAAAAEEVVALKQNITDNSLETTAKTVPGAINELNTDKLNQYYLDTPGLDLDNCTDAGLYEINTTVANMPPGADGGNMIVSYNPHNNAVVQTYFATIGQIASRYKSGSNAWTPWVSPFESRPVLHYAKNIQGTSDGSGNILLSNSLDNVVVVNARIRGNNTWSLGYTTAGGYYLHVQGYNGESLPNTTVYYDIIYYQYDWTA